MEIKAPAPRQSPYSAYYKSNNDIDWNLSSPIGDQDQLFKVFPCRGTLPGPVQSKYKAGENIKLKFRRGFSDHDGGHCQFSVSYDNGMTFAVFHTIMKTCFLDSYNFNIKLPQDLTDYNSTLLMWSWINAIGKREYYTNCIDIAVVNQNKSITSFTGYSLVIANLPNNIMVDCYTFN